MDPHHPMTRRDSLKRLLGLTGCVALTGGIGPPFELPCSARAESKKIGFLVEGVGQTEGYSIRALTRRTFEAVGGMSQFVSRGDVVVIKANLSWARPPRLAATTDPEVLQAVVELCQEAGAGEVVIADNTIQDARRCFALTGAEMVARTTGAKLIYPGTSLIREMKIGGNRLDVWPVFIPVVEADKLINLPVAKHHALTTLTAAMKSWIGAIGGKRGSLHQNIDQHILDLARFFKPTLTLVDAIRIMTRNGPAGGSPSYVEVKNTLILSDDQVAADIKACELFGRRPSDIAFIRLAQNSGLGVHDLQGMEEEKVIL